MKAIVRSLMLLICLVAGDALSARTPFPDFTGQPLTVVDVPNAYQTLVSDIQRIQPDSPQTYYVVVISNSGSGTWATRNYIDELYGRWRAQADQQGIPLDPLRSVLILLAIENRQLSMHAGSTLQNEYGLRGQRIDQEIVQPHFTPHARAGNYAEGLRALLAETEKWLGRKESAKRRATELAAARAATLQRDATATVESVKRLVAEALQEIAARRPSGLLLKPFADQVQGAEQQLAKLESLLSQNPKQALQQGRQSQQKLRASIDQIRQLATLQSEAQSRLEEVNQHAVRSEKMVDQARRQNLAIDPIHDELVTAFDALSRVRATIHRDPSSSWQSIDQVRQQLDSIDVDVNALPELKQQVNDSQTAVAALQQQVADHFNQVAELGANVAAAKDMMSDIETHLAAANTQRETDYRLALATLQQAAQELRDVDNQLRSIAGRYVFRTRTLPLIVVSSVLAFTALVLLLLIVRHLRLKKAVQKQVAEFKRRAVALSDRYDALKQQHQYLPFSDSDFKEPMQGTTLTVYDEIDDNLGRIRQHWLSLMDLVQQIDGLVATEWMWSTKRLSHAWQLANEAPALDVNKLDQESVAQLARLEQAHEGAEARLQEVQLLRTGIVEQLEAIQDANLAVDPYQSDLHVADESIANGQSILVVDPLEAHAQLNKAHEQFARLQQWIGTVLENLQRSAELRSRLEDVVTQRVEHRASGLKLMEDGGNPNPWLSAAGMRLEGAVAALDRGDVDGAKGQLGTATADVQRADDVMRRVVSAKAFCETEIPARRAETQRLGGELQRAHAAQDALQRSFADESWRNVADNLSQARELLSALDPTTDRAVESASLEMQNYFQAASTLQTVQAQQQRIAALAAAVEGRLQELNELSQECRSLSDKNLEDARRTNEFVQQHDHFVRAGARSLLNQAEQALGQSRQIMEAERVHWPAAWRELETAQVALTEALEEATLDVRCHEELTQRLQSVYVAVRNVDDLLRAQTADRPRANRQYQAARQSIERIERQCSVPQADWSLLLARLTVASEDIAGAERLAKQDIQLARQATDAILAATRLCEQARSYYRHGISAQVGPIASQLDGLQRQLRSQNYEQVIEQAQSTARAAREAYDYAVGRARQKQRRLKRERRRRESARQASSSTFLNGSSISSSSSFGSAGSFSGSSSSSFSSGSSSSSFSSGSSQSSW